MFYRQVEEFFPAMTSYELTQEEVHRFHEQGYLGPFELRSPSEMERVRETLENDVLESTGVWSAEDFPPFVVDTPMMEPEHVDRHVDSEPVAGLCLDPAVTDRLESLLGPDLLLYQSQFLFKNPDGTRVAPHQDSTPMLNPPLALSVWLAVTDATKDNGCLEVYPGTNGKFVPHVPIEEEDVLFENRVDPEYVDVDGTEHLELEAGEFVIFANTLAHASGPNTTDDHRLALSVRVTPPFVELDLDNDFRPESKAMVMSGRNYGYNDAVESTPLD